MRILLCCNAGMSSSILVGKIKDAATKLGEEVEVKAVPSTSVKEEAKNFDVVLVGPQLIYAVETLKAESGLPVAGIDPRSYAMGDGEAVLKLAKTLIG